MAFTKIDGGRPALELAMAQSLMAKVVERGQNGTAQRFERLLAQLRRVNAVPRPNLHIVGSTQMSDQHDCAGQVD